MIADLLSNWRKYGLGEKFEKAFEYLEALKPDAPLGRHEIDGQEVYATISEYATSDASPEFLEVHRKYADIQITLAGRETLGWITNKSFEVRAAYDANKDCEFLEIPEEDPFACFDIDEKSFAVFFPDDAHIGKMAPVTGSARIKKVVVKVAL
jgi:YhcH/YjgK/YiaL family protein